MEVIIGQTGTGIYNTKYYELGTDCWIASRKQGETNLIMQADSSYGLTKSNFLYRPSHGEDFPINMGYAIVRPNSVTICYWVRRQ